MKILFLGTGAADYTGNEKELRRNSSALIDDIILIDPNSSRTIYYPYRRFLKTRRGFEQNALPFGRKCHSHSITVF